MPNYILREVEKLADDLGIDRKRSIGEVAKELKVKTHVIRFWEENFPQIKPEIGAGKRRYYYNKQVKILKNIKKFLYEDGYTIAGLQKILRRKKSENNDLNELDDSMFIDDASEVNNDANNDLENKKIVTTAAKNEIEIDDFISEENFAENVISENPDISKNSSPADEALISQASRQDEKQPIITGSKIDLQSRLLDFSSIEISSIDPELRKKIQKEIREIRANLQSLKTLKTN